MAHLSKEHINYIASDLSYRGLVQDVLREELLDHICAAVEEEMESGKRFIDAYNRVLVAFGHTMGIRQLQQQDIYTRTKTRGMLKSYLLIAIRNHLKNKFYTIINITGLAVGIAACLTILLYVVNELNYDRYNANADRIYRVDTEIKIGSSLYHMLALGSSPLAELFRETYPEVENSVRILNWGWRNVSTENSNNTFAENVVWGDSTFFEVFTVPLLEGDKLTVLDEPNTIAISKKMADKYFPGKDALNQTIIIDQTHYKITGVYKDIPQNSQFHFTMIRSMVNVDLANSASLIGGGEMNLFLLLKKGADASGLEAKFPAFVQKYVAPQLSTILKNDFSMKKFLTDGNRWRYSLMPLTAIHLHSNMVGDFEANGSIVYVYLFSTVALFILIIACINFMNLSTARSTDRAREVGVRKVLGSLRSHLVRQFLTESFILSGTAFAIGLALAWFILPLFNDLADCHLTLPLGNYAFYLVLIGAALLVGVMAGLYPSFFLAGFKPVNTLKGKTTRGNSNAFIRGGLVVFQFVISIFLIVGTIAIQRQLHYIQNKRLGFNKDQVVVVHDAGFLGHQLQSFKDEVVSNSFITSGTVSGYLPVEDAWHSNNTFWPEGKSPTGSDVNEMVSMQNWDVDYDYLTTLGLTLKKGRNFSREFPADSADHVIINEEAVRQFGLGPDPIGKKVSSFTSNNPDGTLDENSVHTWSVIGVIADFNFQSMKQNITPLGLFLGKSDGFVSFRFGGSDTKRVLDGISAAWNKMNTGHPFNYSFLDQDFGRMYASEARLATIFSIFSGLAILIACLGLFALTAFTAQQRTKEIGIRKTLGASVQSIVVLLSRSYGKLVIISFVVAAPLSWYAVHWWLQSYSYRATIGVMVYLLAGGGAFLIAMLTIGYQCVRAAMANPVVSLRSE